jgi:hypothetical protein
MRRSLFAMVMIAALHATVCCAQVATGNIRGFTNERVVGQFRLVLTVFRSTTIFKSAP